MAEGLTERGADPGQEQGARPLGPPQRAADGPARLARVPLDVPPRLHHGRAGARGVWPRHAGRPAPVLARMAALADDGRLGRPHDRRASAEVIASRFAGRFNSAAGELARRHVAAGSAYFPRSGLRLETSPRIATKAIDAEQFSDLVPRGLRRGNSHVDVVNVHVDAITRTNMIVTSRIRSTSLRGLTQHELRQSSILHRVRRRISGRSGHESVRAGQPAAPTGFRS